MISVLRLNIKATIEVITRIKILNNNSILLSTNINTCLYVIDRSQKQVPHNETYIEEQFVQRRRQ